MPYATRSARILGLAAIASALLAVAGPPDESRRADGALLARGKAIFETHCVDCHGMGGHGDGKASNLLLPRPSDLTAGRFKLRSTPQGSPPTDEDLLATVMRGVPGSAMPSFAFLPENDRRAVVRYVKSLSPLFAARQAAASASPTRAAPSGEEAFESIAAGKALYQKLQCAICHGDDGQGDGPAADALRDAFDLPIKPRNFASQPFKGGHEVRDIYLRITTGMEGTPMAAFAAQASDRERWQLARFVQSLCRASVCNDTVRPAAIVSKRIARAVPEAQPLSASWRGVPAVRIDLNALWNNGPTAPQLDVRSLNDGRVIAFLLEWDDPTPDLQSARPEDFRDAVAIQFARSPQTPIAMGSSSREVTIWHWKADWQAHLDRGRRVAGTDVHPWMVTDPYPLAALSARDAGNLFAAEKRESPVEQAMARGFGSLTSLPGGDQHVMGKGVWQEGRWHVVLSRNLRARNELAPIRDGTPVAFAVWNGSVRQRDGQKAVSSWYSLTLER